AVDPCLVGRLRERHEVLRRCERGRCPELHDSPSPVGRRRRRAARYSGAPDGYRSGMARAHVGCSGWMYRDWRGCVYPQAMPTREWFAYYTTLFDTVELNSTFYRLPPPET